MRALIIVLFIFCKSLSGQTIDTNTKKGFAVNGYDVVAYFDNKIEEGDKKFQAIFNGVNYKFSSQEHLKLFNRHPEKYIPQYGGYCAYAVALKSDKVSINPKSYLIIDEKLYLFYNAWGTNTLKLWQEKDQNALIAEANINWENIKFKK